MTHIRFGDDEKQAGRSQQGAVTSPTGPEPQIWKPVQSVRTDFDSKDECYVFDLVQSPTADRIAASLSNKRIKLYAVRGGADIGFVGEFVGHEGKVNDLAFASAAEPQTLLSCSSDSTIRGWDARSGQEVER